MAARKRRNAGGGYKSRNVGGGVKPKGQKTDFFNPEGKTSSTKSGRNQLGKSRRSSKYNTSKTRRPKKK